MASSYIPQREADLVNYATNFATLLAANPPKYGLGVGDATTMSGLVADYTAAVVKATNPVTRTEPAVADKDAKKASMIVMLRFYAQVIKKNLAVSNEDKLALGLRLTDPSKTPVPAPTTQPLLSIVGATPLQHTVRFADASTPDKRSKPPGAKAMVLFCYIAPPQAGGGAPTDPALADFTALATKQPCIVTHDPANVGKTAYYFGRWATGTGLLGPWSSPVSMTIAA